MCTLQLADYKSAPRISCVYILRHSVSGREYVGRTCDLRDRMRKHWQELICGKHKNPKITRTYHKYGGDFVFSPIVIDTPERCEEIEGEMLEKIDLRQSLNCHRNNVGGWRGQEWSDESRKKLSDARRGKRPSPESKARAAASRAVSAACKAHLDRLNSPECRAKLLAAAATPESRAKAVATRAANGHRPFSDETRQRQKDASRNRIFAALDWAVANKESRMNALKLFSCSWDGLRKYQPEWEAIHGPLMLPKRASGERNGNAKLAKARKENT